jgi:tetratricopeptide (TPR) repeat protein
MIAWESFLQGVTKMKKVVNKKMFEKALLVFIIALWCLIGIGSNGLLFAEPTANDSTSNSNQFEPIAKAIQQKIKELETPDDVGQDLVKMVRDWRCAIWKQKLDQARLDFQEKKISADQIAQIEDEVIKELYVTMTTEIAYDYDNKQEFWNLSEAIKNKKTHCFGYSVLFLIIGNSIGLSVENIYTQEPPTGSFPALQTHMASLANLSNNKIIMVDLAWGFVSKSFVLNEEFAKDGNYWQLKDNSNPLGIHKRIQLCDTKGLLAAIYLCRAREFAKLNKFTDDIIYSTKALELDPLNENAYISRAYAYDNLGKHQEAFSDCQKAVELNPKSAKTYFYRGIVNCTTGKITDAISDYNKAIEIDPKLVEAYNNRGQAFFNSNKYLESITDFDQAIKINPKYAPAYYGRGVAYSRSNKYLEALSDITRSMELDPKDVGVDKYFNRGFVFYNSVIYTEAISDFTKVIELNPKYIDAYLWRGLAYDKLDKNAEAISDFTKVIELNPKYIDAYLWRGFVYNKMDKSTDAIADFTKGIDLKPNDANIYYSRGNAYYKNHQYLEAISDFTKVIELDSKNANAYIARGSAQAVLGKSDEAKKDLQKAVKLDPTLKEQAKATSDQYQLGLEILEIKSPFP